MPEFRTERLPRTIRYIILVDGGVAECRGQHFKALHRAYTIKRTWTRWEKIEVVDSWGMRPRVTIATK